MKFSLFSVLLAVDVAVIAGIAAAAAFAVISAIVAVVLLRKKKPSEAPAETAEQRVDEPEEETPTEQPETAEIFEETTVAETEELPVERVSEAPAPAAQETVVPVCEEPSATLKTEETVQPTDSPMPPAEKLTRKIRFAPANRLVAVRYDKSFTAKLIQTSDQNKAYYSELKNEILSYKKVKARTSWKQESFRFGRASVAKFEIRGKTLCLYLALESARYNETKYLVEDVSEVKKNESTPCLYRIKNDRRLRYAKDLLADVFQNFETQKLEIQPVDYAKDFPYEETEPLIDRELVKLIEERTGVQTAEEAALASGEIEIEIQQEVSVAAAEELMKDEIAEVLVRQSESLSARGKQTIVNVDTLGEYFSDGEVVTLEEMRDRIPFLNKKATCVKVLARGVLSKSLTVEADDFSLAAVKMIVLAGGDVYRKRNG